MDAAEIVGCCRAVGKEECSRPPCPCNLDAYSPAELRELRRERSLKPRACVDVSAYNGEIK